jgi:hypothetical protein
MLDATEPRFDEIPTSVTFTEHVVREQDNDDAFMYRVVLVLSAIGAISVIAAITFVAFWLLVN